MLNLNTSKYPSNREKGYKDILITFKDVNKKKMFRLVAYCVKLYNRTEKNIKYDLSIFRPSFEKELTIDEISLPHHHAIPIISCLFRQNDFTIIFFSAKNIFYSVVVHFQSNRQFIFYILSTWCLRQNKRHYGFVKITAHTCMNNSLVLNIEHGVDGLYIHKYSLYSRFPIRETSNINISN